MPNEFDIRLPWGYFKLRLGPTLLFLVMLFALLGLGAWQVERLYWKADLLRVISNRTHQEPIKLETAKVVPNLEYRKARVTGLFQHDHELFLTAISKTGEGGFHILTPLQLEGGGYILVDRGWVPYDKKEAATRPQSRLAGPNTVTGFLRIPKTHWLQPANQPQHNNWYGVDLVAMASAAGVPAFYPYVLEADDTINEGGYPLGGQTRVTLPNNHFVYALTWFGLALALCIIYGVSGYRKVS